MMRMINVLLFRVLFVMMVALFLIPIKTGSMTKMINVLLSPAWHVMMDVLCQIGIKMV
jgi:hypothetical protein